MRIDRWRWVYYEQNGIEISTDTIAGEPDDGKAHMCDSTEQVGGGWCGGGLVELSRQ